MDEIYNSNRPNKLNLIGVFPSYQKFDEINSDFKCCIIRDPIKRFLSAYKNRILYHKDSSFRDYSVDMVLDKLIEKKFKNKHFLPQYYFLGHNLKYYSYTKFFYSGDSILVVYVLCKLDCALKHTNNHSNYSLIYLDFNFLAIES